MQIEIMKIGEERSAEVCVTVNGTGKTFGGTNAAFEYLQGLVRETQAAVDSSIATYNANRKTN